MSRPVSNSSLQVLLKLLSLNAIVFGVMCLLWISGVDADAAGEGMANAASKVRPYRWAIALVRWGLWVLAWLYWERIGHWLLRKYGPAERSVRHARWLSQRGQVMGVVVVMELVIVVSFLRF